MMFVTTIIVSSIENFKIISSSASISCKLINVHNKKLEKTITHKLSIWEGE